MDIVKFTKDSPLQRIKAWYIDENSLELSEKDQAYKDRLFHIWSLRAKRDYTRQQAIEIIAREYNVSQATAYRDYSNSQLIFGSIDATNLAADRMIYIERYERLYQLAIKKGDIELAKKINDSLVKLLPVVDENKVDPKKLEASNYILKLPRSTNKLITKMLTGGIVDFNSIGAEDVEFKEILETEEEEEDVE